MITGIAVRCSTALMVTAEAEAVLADLIIVMADGSAVPVRAIFPEDSARAVAGLLVKAADALRDRLDVGAMFEEYLDAQGKERDGEASPQTD